MSTPAQHTPGPWTVRADVDADALHVESSDPADSAGHVCRVSYPGNPPGEQITPACRANARLIAAAPELAEALSHFVTCSEDAGWAEACAHLPELEAAMESTRAALAKLNA